MSSSTTPENYRRAGVDMDAAEAFVEGIKPIARRTHRSGVLGNIGGFGALFALDTGKYRNPVLVSGTDGVGTKVLLAKWLNQWETIGVDLVAMCVNDILTLGAEPLFFLDYLAVGKLEIEKGTTIIRGIAEGCKQAGCALIGGETAEMPGVYSKEDADLAGFAVGVVEQAQILDGSNIRPGDHIVGIFSSGLHSNGFSLARKIVLGTSNTPKAAALERLGEKPASLGGRTLGNTLLQPTQIYVKAVRAFLDSEEKRPWIHGMAHITGGGIPGNLPRILPEGCKGVLQKNSWPVPPVFEVLRDRGNVSKKEMFRAFNMGIGMILIVDAHQSDTLIDQIQDTGLNAATIGEITKKTNGEAFELID